MAGNGGSSLVISSSSSSGKLPDPEVAVGAAEKVGSDGLHEKTGSLVADNHNSQPIFSQAEVKAQKPPKEGFIISEVRVPVTISVMIIALYIFGGAVLFSLWETEWNYLIGAYFCFITLSTIGFGDYVFGTGDDFSANEKVIFCALYLVLGLSIIAMCFDLMQEEVRAKCVWLGTKLGIIDKKEKE